MAPREFDPDALRRIRRERGVTQYQLADATGIPRPAISVYEAGRREPFASTLARIAAALDTPMDAFMRAEVAA